MRRRRKKKKPIARFIVYVFVLSLIAGGLFIGKDIYTKQVQLEKVPESLAELYERNPEARQFVLDYEKEHDKTHSIDLSEFAMSDKPPLLMQWDKRWGYDKYAGDFFALSGCGPTCMSMVYIYLTGDVSGHPAYMAEFAEANGFASNGNGTKWAFIPEGGSMLGLDVTEIPLDKQRIDNNLEVGNPIICIMGPGKFTSTGHFIIIVGVKDGKYMVNDPNSYANSNKLWEFDEFSNEIRNLWVIRR